MLSLLCSRTPFLGASTMDGFSKICAEITSKFSPPVKVLSLLEACFDLTSGSSLHIKIQIMGGKLLFCLCFYLKCKWLTSPATSVSDGSSELEESGLEFFL